MEEKLCNRGFQTQLVCHILEFSVILIAEQDMNKTTPVDIADE